MKLTIITIIMKKTLTTIFLTACALCASATDYYVSLNGAGSKDGSNWENAWSLEEFKTNFNSDNSKTFFSDGDNVYFAPGKYAAVATFFIRKGLNLIGATGTERTIFSGDVNNNGIVDSSDRDRFLQILTDYAFDSAPTVKGVTITDIDFDGFNVDQGGNDTKGAIYIKNSGALITIRNCNFTNIINASQGANAIFSICSNLKVVDCTFKNNTSANRGVAVRLQGNSTFKYGYTRFEHCLFADNIANGETGDPCGVVMMQHGQQMSFDHCTFVNNKINGKGASIWDGTAPGNGYPRTLIVTDCLFYNNTSADGKNIVLDVANTTSSLTNSVIHNDTSVSGAINISSVGVGTYYLSLPFTMPAGVTGKTFSDINGTTLTVGETYTAGDVVPAGTALLVEGSEGTYDPVVAESDDDAPTGNLLKGSDLSETTTGGAKYYKLANDTGLHGLGFYWGAANGAAFTNGAHKAYLALSGESSARSFFSFFDNDVTAIDRIATTTLRKDGKFIENGRIVIMKNGVKYNTVGQKM